MHEIERLQKRIASLEFQNNGLRKERDEADQILGKLLGYPEYPEGSGDIQTAPHTLLSLCDEVVERFRKLEQWVAATEGVASGG